MELRIPKKSHPDANSAIIIELIEIKFVSYRKTRFKDLKSGREDSSSLQQSSKTHFKRVSVSKRDDSAGISSPWTKSSGISGRNGISDSEMILLIKKLIMEKI